MKATYRNAFPGTCFLDSMVMFLLGEDMLRRLQENMSDEDIIAGSKGVEPHLEKMRQISCRGCAETRCPLNRRPKPVGALWQMKQGSREARQQLGERFLQDLLPTHKRDALIAMGVEVSATQWVSLKNPKLIFRFTRGENTQSLIFEAASSGRLIYNGTERRDTFAIPDMIDEMISTFS